MDSGRLETFSDGVFCVAITLLVLNLHVRGPGHGSLLRQSGDQWPAYAALCVTFLLIGVIWPRGSLSQTAAVRAEQSRYRRGPNRRDPGAALAELLRLLSRRQASRR
jgi:hypothetical protein